MGLFDRFSVARRTPMDADSVQPDSEAMPGAVLDLSRASTRPKRAGVAPDATTSSISGHDAHAGKAAPLTVIETPMVDGAAIANVATLKAALSAWGQWLGTLSGVVAPEMAKSVIVLNMGAGDCVIAAASGALASVHMQTVRQRLLESWRFTIVEEVQVTTAVIDALHDRMAQSNALQYDDRHLAVYDNLVEQAVTAGASDMHFRTFDSTDLGEVRLRLFGEITPWRVMPRQLLLDAIGAAFGRRAKENTATKEQFSALVPVAFMTRQRIRGADIEGRFNGRPHVSGYSATMRLIESSPRAEDVPTLAQLGYSPSHIAQIEPAVRRDYGLIVIFGTTGSGKSTTLLAFMAGVTDLSKLAAFTVESPVEYVIPGATQYSLPVDVNATREETSRHFLAVLRDTMRQDPDVLMVGEVRDRETGSLVSEFVQTGHRSYTTCHGSGCVDGLLRLCSGEIQIEAETVAAPQYLSVSMYQRLLPKLCPHCKLPASDTKHGLSESKRQVLRTKFRLDPGTMYVANPGGCEDCKPRAARLKANGTYGVTVACEVLVPNAQIRAAIALRNWTEVERIWRAQRRAGFGDPDMLGKTAYEHGLYLVSQGLVSLNDLEKVDHIESYEVWPMLSGSEGSAQ